MVLYRKTVEAGREGVKEKSLFENSSRVPFPAIGNLEQEGKTLAEAFADRNSTVMGKKAHFSQPLQPLFRRLSQTSCFLLRYFLWIPTNRSTHLKGFLPLFWSYFLFFFHKRLNLYLHLLSLSCPPLPLPRRVLYQALIFLLDSYHSVFMTCLFFSQHVKGQRVGVGVHGKEAEPVRAGGCVGHLKARHHDY